MCLFLLVPFQCCWFNLLKLSQLNKKKLILFFPFFLPRLTRRLPRRKGKRKAVGEENWKRRKIDWEKMFVFMYNGGARVVLCNLISILYFKQKQDNFLVFTRTRFLCKLIRLELSTLYSWVAWAPGTRAKVANNQLRISNKNPFKNLLKRGNELITIA